MARAGSKVPSAFGNHLGRTLRRCLAQRGMRRLILESMGFEGVFQSVKDYLQPILQAAAAVYLTKLGVGMSEADGIELGRDEEKGQEAGDNAAAADPEDEQVLLGHVAHEPEDCRVNVLIPRDGGQEHDDG